MKTADYVVGGLIIAAAGAAWWKLRKPSVGATHALYQPVSTAPIYDNPGQVVTIEPWQQGGGVKPYTSTDTKPLPVTKPVFNPPVLPVNTVTTSITTDTLLKPKKEILYKTTELLNKDNSRYLMGLRDSILL
jgi:hypothetical protein